MGKGRGLSDPWHAGIFLGANGRAKLERVAALTPARSSKVRVVLTSRAFCDCMSVGCMGILCS